MSQCMIVPGDQSRYPQIRVNGKMHRRHRVECEKAHGAPEAGQHALHSCDNKRCINPEHLSWGSPQKNTVECRDRQAAIGRQVLTREQAYAIKYTEVGTNTEIAQRYGVSRNSVALIRGGFRWKDL